MRVIVPVLAFCLAACSASAFPFIGGGERVATQTTMSAYDALDSFGVCAHLTWTTPESAANVMTMLGFLGIKHLRFDVSADAILAAVTINQNLGTKFDALITRVTDYETKRDLILDNISIMSAVEGMNEINAAPVSWEGLPLYEAERAAMQQIYDDFHELVPVYTSTLSLNVEATYPSMVANYAPWAGDYVTSHIYPVTWDKSPYQSMVDKRALDAPLNPSQSVFTEIGAFTVTSTGDRGEGTFMANSAVTQTVQAKHNINALFDGLLLGIKKTFLYELVDNSSETEWTDSERHFGQFNYDMTPKLSASAINIVTNILRDTVQARVVDLDYSLSGLGTNTHSFLIQKSDGYHILALWQDYDLWDHTTQEAVVIEDDDVSLVFGGAKKITIYDPLLGSSPTSVQSGTSFTISVPDHVILIKVESP